MVTERVKKLGIRGSLPDQREYKHLHFLILRITLVSGNSHLWNSKH